MLKRRRLLSDLLAGDLRGQRRQWIEATVRFAASELAEGRLASSSVMARLSETLLIEVVHKFV